MSEVALRVMNFCDVFRMREDPFMMGFTNGFISWMRYKGKMYSYEYGMHNGQRSKVITKEDIPEIRERIRKKIGEFIESILRYRRDREVYRVMEREIRSLKFVESNVVTLKAIAKMLKDAEKYRAKAWHIINRIEFGGREYKDDGKKIHKYFDEARRLEGLYEEERGKIVDGDYFYDDRLGFIQRKAIRIESGVNEGLYDVSYLQVGTGRELSGKELGVCYIATNVIRTMGDKKYYLKKFTSEFLPNFKEEYKRHTGIMRGLIIRYRSYLNELDIEEKKE